MSNTNTSARTPTLAPSDRDRRSWRGAHNEALRVRSRVSLDGKAMNELADIAAIYSLKTRTMASHSALIRRAIGLLHQHAHSLLDLPDSHLDVLSEGAALRSVKKLREGVFGWSLDAREQRDKDVAAGLRKPLEIDMDEGDDDEG